MYNHICIIIYNYIYIIYYIHNICILRISVPIIPLTVTSETLISLFHMAHSVAWRTPRDDRSGKRRFIVGVP